MFQKQISKEQFYTLNVFTPRAIVIYTKIVDDIDIHMNSKNDRGADSFRFEFEVLTCSCQHHQ